MLIHGWPTARDPGRVTLLGANGFVARAVAERLDRAGVQVQRLSREVLDLTAGDAQTQLAARLDPGDVLVVAAARAPVKTNAQLIENLTMMQAVCAAVAAVPPSHAIYVSSDAVYADDDAPLTEGSRAEPASLHGAMHATREVMLRQAFAGPIAMVRPTLIYGRGDPHNGYGPNRFVRQARLGESITLFGAGEERRDHVLIDDVADIIARIVRHRSAGVLNIATGEVWSFAEIAAQVSAAFAHSPPPRRLPRLGPMPHRGYRPFDVTAVHRAFPDFAFTALPVGLARLCAEAETVQACDPAASLESS
jgi:nucleoside-diphosphate-sugar epimerase